MLTFTLLKTYLAQWHRLDKRLTAGGLITLFVCLWVMHLLFSSPEPTQLSVDPSTTVLTNPPINDTASTDNAEETLATVAAEYNQLLDEVRQLKQAQKAYQAHTESTIKALRDTIAQLTTRLNEKQPIQPPTLQIATPPPTQATTSHLKTARSWIKKVATAPADAPLGIIDDINVPVNQVKSSKKRPPFYYHAGLTPSVKPLMPSAPTLSVTPNTMPTKQPTPSDEVIPYYTLPANATGLNATLMTALVGRIPVKGHVQDPYPFKILLGKDNLAANGLMLPDVSGMVISGFAVGDLTLQGVKGWIHSVTFVFPDGRIHTINAATQSSGQPSLSNSLGYLSDPHGNPFLPGRLITNAPRQLATQVALNGAEGAAGAWMQSGLKRSLSTAPLSSTPIKTQDLSHWLTGSMAQQATQQLNRWWQDRQSGAFDAIYVPAGQPVVINFTQTLPIDYHKHGRKLRYDTTQFTTHKKANPQTMPTTLATPQALD